MKAWAITTRLFHTGESLVGFVVEHIPSVTDGSIIVVTSKIVSLSQSRTTSDTDSIERLVREESEWMTHTRHVWMAVRDGISLPSAGIDASNGDGRLILPPDAPFVVARSLRDRLRAIYGVDSLGVLITDSHIVPLRAGTVGVALGYAGFSGIRDYRGRTDLYGRTLVLSRTNIADSLATTATFLMGEGDERRPLAVIEDVPANFVSLVDANECRIDTIDDAYGTFFSRIFPEDTTGTF